jgi:hypothetical protein
LLSAIQNWDFLEIGIQNLVPWFLLLLPAIA